MPFTLSHPAAVLPLAHRGLIPSALIIGSMAPDFEYFIRFSTGYSFGHTFLGLFTLTLPLGLLVFWLFHTLLKVPLLALLPPSHYARLYPISKQPQPKSFQYLGLVILSLLLGATTHIVWDLFTHENTWVVQRFVLLQVTVAETPFGSLKMYKLLQHSSTLLGGLVLLLWYFRWYQRTAIPIPQPSPPLDFWQRWGVIVIIGSLAILLAGLYGASGLSGLTSFQQLYIFLGRSVVSGIPILFVVTCLYSGGWHWLHSKTT